MSLHMKMAHVGKNCVACGNCVKNCPVSAITVYKGLYALVNESKCIGCGRCRNACPAGVIELLPKRGAL